MSVPAPMRRRAETVTGVDLDDVRITRGGAVGAAAARRGADAASSGNVIAFPRGLPDPARPAGRFALAHELAHVAQQRHRSGPVGGAGAGETQADATARAISGVGPAAARRNGEVEPSTMGGAPIQFGVFDAIGGAIRTVDEAVSPIVDPVMQSIDESIAEVMLNQLDLPALAISFVTNTPERLLRFYWDAFEGALAAGSWVYDFVGLFLDWQSWDAVWTHLLEGALGRAEFALDFFVHALEIVGAGEFLQFLWARANRLAPLDAAQIGAAQEVHPPGLIPYAQVRVDYNSLIARLASLFSPNFSGSVWEQIVGSAGASHRAVTTMHIIHAGRSMDEPLAVHELAHVAQYELVGAMYMPEAVHAQQFGQGYDYNALHGSLSASIAAGAVFADFNREQQAQICEDLYRVRHGMPALQGGAQSELQHFVDDYWGRAGIPIVRNILPQ
jgi:hypothetical protein